MKNIKILDCTLRDGGRIIDCKFPDDEIRAISTRLAKAKIDIIEIGFLRDWHDVKYQGDSTFFTDVDQIAPFVDRTIGNAEYVAFVDYGMFDFSSLKPFDGRSIDGIRVGFTKQDFNAKFDDIVSQMNLVKDKGYKLFIQGVNSLSYSDQELLGLVEKVNRIKPYGFGIVDTYGAMYMDDVDRIYGLVDHNLEEDITIDFHSHNNYQLSFAFAQEIIKLNRSTNRKIILDATLNGMGKCAGNLNSELILDFLVRKMNYDYDFDAILDIIDDHIYNYCLKFDWGYSIPALMGGIYKSHPNNIIYLTEKFRLATKDIKYIISMIDPMKRSRYDYDYIKQLYDEYNHIKVDDVATLEMAKELIKDRKILILLPGASIMKYETKIKSIIERENLLIISVNFIHPAFTCFDYLTFWGSEKRYIRFQADRNDKQAIITSNITSDNKNDLVINYDSYVDREDEYSDNSMLMLLKFLQKIGLTEFKIAGFDGFIEEGNYCDNSKFGEERFADKYKEINEGIIKSLKKYVNSIDIVSGIEFITPSIYETVFH